MADTTDVYDGVGRVAQALASGTRLKMLELLAQSERSVSALAELAEANLTTVSAQLHVLREAGLVASRREGRQVFYRLSGDDVAALVVRLSLVAERHRPSVSADLAAALPTDDVRLMSRQELLDAARSGAVVVLDVRPAEEFAAGHVEGAMSIPLAELAQRLGEVPADVEVVAYCRGRYCVLSHRAVRMLTAAGRSARLAEDGIAEWVAAGIALHRTPTGP